MATLKITGLQVSVDDKPILKGVNLEIKAGEIHALMGPNGSGKSTLAYALAGHPKYEITGGTIEIDETNVTELDANERARLGMFLAFQYPVTIPGVRVADFLRHAVSNRRDPDRKEGENLIPMREFRKELKERMGELFDLEYDLLMYDVTSTYFEGQVEGQPAGSARLLTRQPRRLQTGVHRISRVSRRHAAGL